MRAQQWYCKMSIRAMGRSVRYAGAVRKVRRLDGSGRSNKSNHNPHFPYLMTHFTGRMS